jgi:hypothetical protein
MDLSLRMGLSVARSSQVSADTEANAGEFQRRPCLDLAFSGPNYEAQALEAK